MNENKEIRGNGVIVYFVRHLKARYEGEKRPENMIEPIDFEGTLITEELAKIENVAEIILKKMDRAKEIALLSASPRKRAFDSVLHLKAILVKNGILVSRGITVEKNLTDATLTGEFLAEYNKIYEQDKNLTWMELWEKEGGKFKNVENQKDFQERIKKFLSSLLPYLQEFPSVLKGDNTSLVCVTHEEVMRGIAKIFGIPIKYVGNGEVMEIVVSLREKKMAIEVQEKTGVLSFEKLNKMEV